MAPSTSAWRVLVPVCLGAVLLLAASVYGIVRLLPRGRATAPRTEPPPAPQVTPVVLTAPASAPAGRPALPPELQEKVNKAIERGLKHLQEKQKADGTWDDRWAIALAALPGLTLLECGVPASDERVRKAAGYVRERLPRSNDRLHTYTCSLVLLFLDRLNDEADRPLIHTLGLRLIAGQKADGGWSYTNPALTPADERKLMLALTATRPQELAQLVRAVEGPRLRGRPAPPEGDARQAVAALPAALRRVPGVAAGPPGKRLTPDHSDNSNTHFAALALWAALRHGVPAERALRATADRFRLTQRPGGRWGYHPTPGGHASPAMTGVGLLGLAIGHGLSGDAERKSAAEDDRVKRGMAVLGRMAGGADAKNLYFLWTLERVGMLYNVREIGGKDWYAHAVDVLLPAQHSDGSWNVGGYHGATGGVDTCLALLILKRANFTEELTRQLQGGLVREKR